MAKARLRSMCDIQARAGETQIAEHVGELRNRVQLGFEHRRPFIQFIQIGILQRQRILAAAFVLSERDQGRRLQKNHQARNLGEFLLQLCNDLCHFRTIFYRLHHEKSEAGILAARKSADARAKMFDPRVAC